LEQILLQPVAGFQIEVVRGLVEQQQVRSGEQQLAQGDAHLPAAGEFFGVTCPIFFAEAEAVEHRADLRVERVAVLHAEFGQDALVAISHLRVFVRGVIQFGNLVSEVFHLLLQGAQVGEDRHAFVEDGASGELQAVLREVAEGGVFGGDDAAVVERFEAAEDLQQRGFAGAVGAHQSDASVGGDEPIQIVEEKLGAEAFAGR
jgi:hypothetical protein